jgi:hypothetical protein
MSRGAVGDAVAEAAGRLGLGVARGSGRAKDPADDLDTVVFAEQLRSWLLADFHLSLPVSRPARHRHGRRMAGRRRTSDGDLAGTFARLHGRSPARLMGSGLHAVERHLRPILRLSRLARHAVDRRVAGAFRFLHSASSSKSRRSGSRTGGASASSNARFVPRLSLSSNRAFSPTR